MQFRTVHAFYKLVRKAIWSCLCPSQIWIYSSSCTEPSLWLSHILTPFRFFSPAHLSPCILYCYKRNDSAQMNWRLSWANSPFAAEPTWGWWNPSLCHPLQQQKCHTQVLKLIWNTGCWLLFPVNLFFKGWALYLYCLREQTGLHKKLHTSRMMYCYG